MYTIHMHHPLTGRPVSPNRKLASNDELICISLPMLNRHGVLGPRDDRLCRETPRPPVLFRWGEIAAVRAQINNQTLMLSPEHGVEADQATIHFIPHWFGQGHQSLRYWLECPLCRRRIKQLYAMPTALFEIAPQLLRHRAFACFTCHDLRDVGAGRIRSEQRWKRHHDILIEKLGPDPLTIPRGTGEQPVRRARHIAKQRRYAAVLARLNGEAAKKLSG